MDSDFLQVLDFGNESNMSEGQVEPENRLLDVENKVREAFDFARNTKNKCKKIRFEKIMPMLNNINAISQHNYSVSQNLLLQNRQLQDKLLSQQEDLKRISDERDQLRLTLEDSQRKSTVEIKLLSNDNDRLQSLISNYRIENDMLKSLLQEKSDIIGSKDAFLNRLENQVRILSDELQITKEKHQKEVELLIKKQEEDDENLRVLTLNLNTKECEVQRVGDLREMEKKEAEKKLRETSGMLEETKIDQKVLLSRIENLEKASLNKELALESTERSLKEHESRRLILERELEKLKRSLENKEAQYMEDLERISNEKVSRSNERIVELEARVQETLKRREEMEMKAEELVRANNGLREELATTKLDLDDQERKLNFIADEKKRFLNDYGEVKKRYEKLVDDLERELKSLRTKVWEAESRNDALKTEVERLKTKEKVALNLTTFKKDQLDSYLRLNVQFSNAYPDVTQEDLETVHKEVEQKIMKLEKSRHNTPVDPKLASTNENMIDPLSFNDLDKEWEMVNTALSNLSDKYRENLSFLQK